MAEWQPYRRGPGAPRRNPFIEAFLLPVKLYRRFLSPLLPPRCRFSPTCSSYCGQAVREWGILRGSALTVWRLLRCNPFGKPGDDPVPRRTKTNNCDIINSDASASPTGKSGDGRVKTEKEPPRKEKTLKILKNKETLLKLIALLSMLCALSALFLGCGGASSWKGHKEVKTEAKTLEEITDEDRAALAELEKEYLEKDEGAPVIEGIGDILGVPFGYIMQGCSFITGHIYVLALLLFTIAMKLLLLPFGIKQQKNMIKQARFEPRQKAIQAKYAGRTDRETMQKMQEELMNAQKEAGVSMFGGCLPILIQFPALICLYSVIQYPLRYMAHLSSYLVSALKVRALTLPADKLGSIADTVNAALTKGKTLTEIAETINQIKLIPIIRDNFEHFADLFKGTSIKAAASLPNFSFFGLRPDLSETPSVNPINWLIAIPIVVFLSYYFSMKLTRKFSYQPPVAEGQPDANKSMKIMDFMMPLFSVYISFTVPSGLAIYWIYSSILGVLQQFLLTRFLPFPKFTEEEYKEAQRIYNGKAPKKKKKADADTVDSTAEEVKEPRPKVRSLHHIDDDDDDGEPEILRDTPVSSRYGDEDEPDAPKPVEKAPVKGLFGKKDKSDKN